MTQEMCQEGLNKTEHKLNHEMMSMLKLKTKCHSIWREKHYCLGQDTLS